MDEATHANSKILKTRTHQIKLRDDGILYCVLQKNVDINLEDAKESVKAIKELIGNNPVPGFYDARSVKSITLEAREYYSQPEVKKLTIAAAVLINSPLSKVIVNFFLFLNKPEYPFRIFTVEQEAIGWLKTFIK